MAGTRTDQLAQANGRPYSAWHPIDPIPTCAADARRYVRDELQKLDPKAPADLVDNVRLIASELVTNAYRAIADAEEPPAPGIEGVIHLALQCCCGRWAHLLVQDPYPASPRPRQASATDESGRGLKLVEAHALFFVDARKHDKTVHTVINYPDVVLTQNDLDRLAVTL